MARLFADFPEAVARTVKIAEACKFSLIDLKYEYPDEPVPPGKTAQQHLEDLTWKGAERRFPDGVPEEVADRLRDELAILERLDYARYFLTVHDVVAYARNLPKPILCQGRGSLVSLLPVQELHRREELVVMRLLLVFQGQHAIRGRGQN